MMRWQGVHHVEFSVLDYDASIQFYDEMFGWLGYKSFWTLDIGYRSTYYIARFPFPHSYIGIQPAKSGGVLRQGDRATGIHHIALWARSKKEVDRFYEAFLLKKGVRVTDPPAFYPAYSPGYYAVFFDVPVTGFHWETAHTPLLPSLSSLLAWLKALKALWKEHPEWLRFPARQAMRALPTRSDRG
jgi:catechol 2,3-dioxygenase-like lactoylglutathione lyase family enzyme